MRCYTRPPMVMVAHVIQCTDLQFAGSVAWVVYLVCTVFEFSIRGMREMISSITLKYYHKERCTISKKETKKMNNFKTIYKNTPQGYEKSRQSSKHNQKSVRIKIEIEIKKTNT